MFQKGLIIGLIVSSIYLIFFLLLISHKIFIKFNCPSYESFTINYLEYRHEYSFIEDNGRKITVVYKNKRLFELFFIDSSSIEPIKMNYYFEKHDSLFVQEYLIENYLLRIVKVKYIPENELKGRNYWFIRKQVNWEKMGYRQEKI